MEVSDPVTERSRYCACSVATSSDLRTPGYTVWASAFSRRGGRNAIELKKRHALTCLSCCMMRFSCTPLDPKRSNGLNGHEKSAVP